MNLMERLDKKEMARLMAQRAVPDFGPGDTLRVALKVVEGTRERVQSFEGVCIARKNAGVNSAFTVRKLSYGEGVERVFPLFSPNIVEIEVKRHGDVRRAKLYYLRGRTGKRARIAEKTGVRPGSGGIAPGSGETDTEVAVASDLAEAPETTTGAAAGGKAAKD
ncbi:MAG TPA: 50S ribosomal protein L19 [Alphaproteobacteria bacterium]|jgi:large subunit ribosomal protein L19